MGSRLDRRFIGPIVLLVVSLFVVIVAWSSAQGLEPVDQPLDLRPGALNEAEFRVRHGGLYAVGVKMNLAQAERLFPCMAGSQAASFGHCAAGDFPLVLRVNLHASGEAAPLHLSAETSRAGGEFSANSFTRTVAYVRLEAWKSYRVTASSRVDRTPLLATAPRMTVGIDAMDRKDIELSAMLIMVLASLPGMAGIVWGVVVALRRSGVQ